MSQTYLEKAMQQSVSTPGKPVDAGPTLSALMNRERLGVTMNFRFAGGLELPIYFEATPFDGTARCRSRAATVLKEKGFNLHEHSAQYEDEIAIQMIWMMTREPEPQVLTNGKKVYHPIFPSAEQVRANLSEHEVAVMWQMCTYVDEKFGNPSVLKGFSDEDIDSWITLLANSGEDYPLFFSDWRKGVELLRTLATRLYSLTQPSQETELPPTSELTLESSTSLTGSSIGQP